MDMSIQVVNLDHRHAGSGIFKYFIILKYSSFVSSLEKNIYYNNVRVWCWENFGPSCERDIYLELVHNIQYFKDKDVVNPYWCWHNDVVPNASRIYLTTEDTLTTFLLRWN